MTYHEAIEFIDEHDLQVLILPAHRGFAVYARTESSISRTLAYADTFESAVELARFRVARHPEGCGDDRHPKGGPR
jgi:hypothetical protein